MVEHPRFSGIVLGLWITVLSSCSGGGGGGGGGETNLQDNPETNFLQQLAEPTSPATANAWSASQEYLNSTGLSQLRAAEGYARRSGGLPGGRGVRIAIIDTGIDVTHPDLGNLAAQSWAAGDEALAGDSHATFVAGIAGASRTQTANANDMHGMAYRATLVNFQAARPSVTQANGFTSFSTSDLVAAIRAAAGLSDGSAAVKSDIINLSLGTFSTNDNTFNGLRTAMQAAAGEGKIMVLAAGNEGLDADQTRKQQPIYPAAYADDPGIAGLAMVVGNLTSGNQAAASSNLCGDTKAYCLFASGTNIRSTLNGGGYGIGSGTSFAAPYVSGAAAVVKAAFPGVSNQDVVNRLLLTAADLGAAGVDTTFGRGRLDLEAAMAPVGPVGLPIGPAADGPSAAVAGSTLQLGPAFAIGEEGRALLARTVGFDEMGFPFPVNLSGSVQSARRASGLESFVGGDRASSASAWLAHGTLSASVADQAMAITSSDAEIPIGLSQRSRRDPTPHLAFSADAADDLTIFASLNGSSGTGLGLKAALADRRMALFQPGDFLAPFEQLAGSQSGGGLAFELAEGFELAVSAFTSIADDGGPEASLQKVEMVRDLPGNIEVRLGLGWLQEDEAFLGGSSKGAFGRNMATRSQFVNLSILGTLTERIDWFGSYSRGRSSVDGERGPLLGDLSSALSEAFGVGLSMRDIARDGDGLSLMVGQPFRSDHAEATINVPLGRMPDGTVVTQRQRIDLAPETREIATEVNYRMLLNGRQNHEIKAGSFLRVNPDHDPGRAPELGFGLSYRWQF